ncbi:diguanylate cyclase [Ancylobacter sp. 6x-1]|uniref:diguanylate cyclase n=1 Tax=Ancylobacter crimeensis TaxID=2579147 RepID=A0ABT0D793_9HYPH|nr:diguanylate cyclase [Ancylobacter crimeensis]MCK0195815.1 diguanylate cyclase [Ancylobacter crimeensis]
MWMPEPPSNESARLEVLAACQIMDTPADERFERLTRLASRVYDADLAFIGLVDEHSQWMKSITRDDFPPTVERRNTVCNLIIQTGKPLVIGDLRSDPRLQGHPIAGQIAFRFYAGVPVMIEPDLAIGSLCILRREPGKGETFDLGPLVDLGAITSDTVEGWRTAQQMRERADQDALTGLANRGRFDSELSRAIRRANRTGAPLSLLLIDLDQFKLVNDLAGHQAGDATLRTVGTLLPRLVRRPYDLACRFGGEEFAIILPDTDSAGALAVAALIRAALAEAALPHPARPYVTASVGVATLQGDDIRPETLIRQADMGLYAAKREGRDRTVHFKTLG